MDNAQIAILNRLIIKTRGANIDQTFLNGIAESSLYENYFDITVPYGNRWGIALTITTNPTSTREQVIFTAGGIAFRHYENSNWSDWKKVSLS